MIKRFLNRKNLRIFALIFSLILVLVAIYYIDLAKFNSKLVKYDSKYLIKVTYLIGDRDKLDENITIDDTIFNNDDSILYNASQRVPLTKNGDYLEADLSSFTNKILLEHVSDYVFANNNLNGETVEGCTYDKEKKVIRVPFSFYKDIDSKSNTAPIQIEIESLLTNKEIKNLKTDYSVKKLITYNNTASNELMQLDTKISLSNYINSDLSKENVYVYLNNSKNSLDKDSFEYDYKTKTLIIDMPAILINKVDIKIGNNIIKNVFAVTPAQMTGYKLTEKPQNLLDYNNYRTRGMVWSGSYEGVSNNNLLLYCYDTTTRTIEGGKQQCIDFTVGNTTYGKTANDAVTVFMYDRSYRWTGSEYAVANTPGSSGAQYNGDMWPYMVNTGHATINDDGLTFLPFEDPDLYILLECIHDSEAVAKASTDPIFVRIGISEDHSSDNYLILKATTETKDRNKGGWGAQMGKAYFKVYWEDSTCKLPVSKTLQLISPDSTDVATVSAGLYTNSTCTGTPLETKNINVTLADQASTSTTFDTDLQIGQTYYYNEIGFTGPGGVNLMPKFNYMNWPCSDRVAADDDGDGLCDDPVNMYNNEVSYCYKVFKTDKETGNPVRNTTWTMTGEDGVVYSPIVFEENNSATFTGLPYQNYTLKETTANPADLDGNSSFDYFNDNAAGVTVNKTSLTLEPGSCNSTTKTDTKVYYCIKIKKMDYSTGEALDGAEFTATKGNRTIDKNSSDYSSSNGITSFFIGDSSTIGAFTITETVAPPGYTIFESSKVVYPVALYEYASEGAARTACLGNNTLAYDGSSFASKTYNNGTNNYVFREKSYLINWYKTVEDGTTKADGAKFKVRKQGTNQFITVSAPESTTDGNSINKACYQYTGTSETGTEMTAGSKGSTNINMTGEVCVAGLPTGTYTIYETEAAEYHTFGMTDNIHITADDTFKGMTDGNKFINYRTEFEFTKDVASGDEVINGMDWSSITTEELKQIAFEVTTENGSTPLAFIKVSDGVYEYVSNDIDSPAVVPPTPQLYIGDNRKIKIYHLPKGSYKIKEVRTCCDTSCSSCNASSCSGYYYPEYNPVDDFKFVIDDCSSSNAYATSSCGGQISTAYTTNLPTSILLTKRDLYGYANSSKPVKFENEDEVNAFDNITFRLKDENGNYVKLLRVDDSATCSNFGTAIYRYVDESLLTQAQRNALTYDLHTCNGHIEITHLCRGKTYIIEEYSVPNNTVFTVPGVHIEKTYQLPFTEDGKMCCNDHEVTPVTQTIIDDEPTRIVLYKKNNRTSDDIHEGANKKETATFEVYACDLNVATCTKNQSTGNKIKFGNPIVQGNETIYPALLDQTAYSGYVTSLNLTTEGSQGKLVLKYLPSNYKYVVVETNAPDGYFNVIGALAETEIASVPTSTTDASANRKNIIDYPTMIKFKKDDIYKYYSNSDVDQLNSSNKIFDTMTFVLRDKDGNIVSLKKVADGEYRYIQNDGTTTGNNVTELHTKNGELLITNIYRNEKYYIEETKSDTKGNFILPKNISKPSGIPSGWNWKGHPYVVYNLGSTLPNGSQGGTVAPESLTSLIENKPTRVVFEKRDRTSGSLIDDSLNNEKITFNVYRCPKTVEHCRANSQGAELVYFEDRAVINGLTDDISSVTPPVLTYKYSKTNSSSNKVSDLITDRGVLVLAYLPSDYSYSLFEKSSTYGYYKPTGAAAYTDFTVLSESTDESDYVDLTALVENTPTGLTFIKSDLYNYYTEDDLSAIKAESSRIFDSISFILRDKDGNILNVKCTSNGEVQNNKNTNNSCNTGEYRYLPVDNKNVINVLHTKNGKLQVNYLNEGETYYIEEVSSDVDKSFVLPDYLDKDLNYGQQLPFDNNGHPVVKYILPSEIDSNQVSVTAEIKNIPTRVIFEKRDKKYNYLIPDETTTFEVYRCPKDNGNNTLCSPSSYNTVEEREQAGMKLIKFEPRSVITNDLEDPGIEVYKMMSDSTAENKTMCTDTVTTNCYVSSVHPYVGRLILRYLQADYNYVLLETVAPTNYNLPVGSSRETPFSVVTNTVSVDEVDIPNKPTALIIRKYADVDGDSEADSTKLLGGAKFKVYKVNNYDPSKKIQDQDKEIVKLKTIKDGIYENRPVLDTDVITTCTGDNCSYNPNTIGSDIESIDDLINASGTNITSVLKEGTALIQYLEYNTYYIIEEVEAPTGYSLPENDDNRFTLVHIKENETKVVDTLNALVNKPTSFTFYKFDEYNTPLDGATFYLQKLDNEKKYNTLTVSKEVLDNGKVVYRSNPLSEEVNITTSGGEATVYYLEPGQYRILEVSAAEGYELPKKTINVATFFVDEDGLVYGNNIITNKKPSETIEYLASDKAELIINIQTGKVVIKYGLIIVLLVGTIVGLMILLKKRK